MNTPRPWRLEWSTRSPSLHVIGSDGMTVATVHVYASLTGDLDQSNAHLISACPDLLEACKEVVEQLRDWRDNHELSPSSEMEYLFDVTRAAIAKATGTSP